MATKNQRLRFTVDYLCDKTSSVARENMRLQFTELLSHAILTDGFTLVSCIAERVDDSDQIIDR